MAQIYLPTDRGGVLRKVTSFPTGYSNDGVFGFTIGGQNYVRTKKGDLTSEEVGIYANGTDQTARLNTVLALAKVKSLTLDAYGGGEIVVSGTVNCGGKELVFHPGTKFVGTGTINAPLINAPIQSHIFGGTILVTNAKTAGTFNSVAWWGAVGDGVTDDAPAIQRAVDAVCKNLSMSRDLYFERFKTYSTNQTIFVENFNTTTGLYEFTSINLIGGYGGENKWKAENATIRANFKDRPLVNFQLCKGGGIRSMNIRGRYVAPVMSLNDFFQTSFAAYGDPLCRDSQFSPYVGIAVDGLTVTGSLPADGGYPALTAKYTRAAHAVTTGSSGLTFSDIFLSEFTVGMTFSQNGQTQNCECMTVEDIFLTVCKTGFSSSQDQEKSIEINRIAAWDQIWVIFTNKHYGATSAGNWYVSNVDVAGSVLNIFDWYTGGTFPFFADKIYAESFMRIGNITGNMAVHITNSVFDFPHNYTAGDNGYTSAVTFTGCTFRKYGAFSPVRLRGYPLNFKNCYFETEPFTDHDGTVVFDDCHMSNVASLKGGLGVKGTFPQAGQLYDTRTSIFGDIVLANFIGIDHGDLYKYNVRYQNEQYIQGFPELGVFTVSTPDASGNATLTLSTADTNMFQVGMWLLTNDNFIGQIVSKNATTVSLQYCPKFTGAALKVYVYAPKRINPAFIGDPIASTNTVTNCIWVQGSAPTVGMCYENGGIFGMAAFNSGGYTTSNCFMVTNVSGTTVTISATISSVTGTGKTFINGSPIFELDQLKASAADVGNSYLDGLFMTAGSKIKYGGELQYLVTKSGMLKTTAVAGAAELLYQASGDTVTVTASANPFYATTSNTYLIDATAGAITLNIQQDFRYMLNREIKFIRIDNTSNVITLDVTDGTINGGSVFILNKSAILCFKKSNLVYALDTSGDTQDAFSLAADGTRAISASTLVDEIYLKATTGMTISIGTTAGGTDVVNAAVLTANVTRVFSPKTVFDSAGTLYITGVSGGTLAVKLIKKGL